MGFPEQRFRRFRKTEALRRLVRETRLSRDALIAPLFVEEGLEDKVPIPSMPGQFRHSVQSLVQEAKEIKDLGIPAVLLFGIPKEKNDEGSQAYHKKGIVQNAVRELKSKVDGLAVITDVCLCEYTSHGHCGIVEKGRVQNDITIELISKTAASHAEAGADIVAPSDMMDGRIAGVRSTLDNEGYGDTPILAYSAKYASAFYGPFRQAVDSAPQFGDRKDYQMDPPNIREALREIQCDIDEGADAVMVKPGLSYLDVLHEARMMFDIPLAVYNVSGEYSMVKSAAEKGWIQEKALVLELLTSFQRAGADMIITYHAKEAAGWL